MVELFYYNEEEEAFLLCFVFSLEVVTGLFFEWSSMSADSKWTPYSYNFFLVEAINLWADEEASLTDTLIVELLLTFYFRSLLSLLVTDYFKGFDFFSFIKLLTNKSFS